MTYYPECPHCGRKIDPESRKGFKVDDVTGNYFCNQKHMDAYRASRRKWVVSVQEVHTVDVEVEAPDENTARELVSDMLADGSVQQDSVYSYTQDVDSWPVRKK